MRCKCVSCAAFIRINCWVSLARRCRITRTVINEVKIKVNVGCPSVMCDTFPNIRTRISSTRYKFRWKHFIISNGMASKFFPL